MGTGSLPKEGTPFWGLSFHLVHWPGIETPTQGTPTHHREVSWPALCICLCLSVWLRCEFEFRSTQLGRFVLGGPQKELMSSDFSPATLEDVPRVFVGAQFFGAQLPEPTARVGLFGAPPLSEGYVALLGDEGSGPSPKSPSELLLSVLRRSRAARLIVGLSVLLSIFLVGLFIYWDTNMGQSLTCLLYTSPSPRD